MYVFTLWVVIAGLLDRVELSGRAGIIADTGCEKGQKGNCKFQTSLPWYCLKNDRGFSVLNMTD